MSIGRMVVSVLDRPPLRGLLARIATAHFRRAAGDPTLEIRYTREGAWIRGARVNGRREYIADSTRFPYDTRLAAETREKLEWRRAVASRMWFHRYEPRPGDVIVDVGAGVGEDAVPFADAVGPHGRVLAIEAHPTTYRLLTAAVAANGLSQVTCEQVAISGEPGTVWIEDMDANLGNTVHSGPIRGGYEVTAVTLDDLCERQGLARVDFLKMNIEGAEQFALAGMVRTLARTRYACIACHDFRADDGEDEALYRTSEKVTQFLEAHGFETSRQAEPPNPWERDHVYGRRSGA